MRGPGVSDLTIPLARQSRLRHHQGMLARRDILPEAGLTPGAELLAEGRRLAQDWRVGPCAFLAASRPLPAQRIGNSSGNQFP